MPFFRSLFTSDIICEDFWPLFIPTLLIESSSKKSSANPFTVCKISGSDVIFAHFFSLAEIQPPLKFEVSVVTTVSVQAEISQTRLYCRSMFLVFLEFAVPWFR